MKCMNTYKPSAARNQSGLPFVATLLGFCLVSGVFNSHASTDYGPAIWRPVYSGHWYSSGYGHKFIVNHDMEGYYLSTISYFQRSSTQASVHYYVNGKKDYTSDAAGGEVSQGVREAYYAWHARCWNQYSLGIEHEGFASNPAWYTEAMYQATAALQRHMCSKFGIAKDRNHIIGHDQKRISGWASYCSSHFGVSGTCNDHTDPGPYWNWTKLMDLINGSTPTPSGPSSLAAKTASASQINLTWKDNSGIEQGFKVERATSSSGPWTQIGTTAANDVTYSATSLSSGTTYYFRVRAYNTGGNSPYSGVASATTSDVVPGAPSALAATAVSGSQINLTWTQGAGNEDGFKIERGTSASGPWTQIATVGINATSYSNAGLLGNTRYYYRVRSYNTAGNSAYSNTANDITAPPAPSGLAATAPAYHTVNLTWTDNASSEAGFKIERGTAAAGPFSQIGTNAASDNTYTDTGRAALTTYYYRVRSYNGNGNSAYSSVASVTTPNAPPVLAAIGNKIVTEANVLSFTATATDPNQTVTTTTWQTFESFTNNTPNEDVMFKKPANSATTSAFIDTTATNYTTVTTTFPATHSSAKVLKAGWSFKTGQVNPWLRLTTFNTDFVKNPTIDGGQTVRFDILSTKALKVGVGVRETGTSAAYGADGGTTGTIDWAGVTNVIAGAPIPDSQIAANTWTTLSFNLPFEPQAGFTGNGDITNAKVTLEHLALAAVNNASGAYTVYLDNFAVVAQNTLTYSLVNAPSGASIHPKTGKFTWTPTLAQGPATYHITVRVTDQQGAQDSEVITVTVNDGGGNAPPILAAIGNKTVNENSALDFTASATDADPGQTLAYSLDAGAPASASINPVTGAFTWTPTEAQGPGSFPITVRATDNGTNHLSDSETITVTVKEVNSAPVMPAITDRTVNENSALSFTVTASDPNDTPANAIAFSLDPGAPAGATINAGSGLFTWTPNESFGPGEYPITVRATDNGSPVLYATRTFLVTVNELNVAPVLTINNTVTTVTPFADFEGYSDGTYNGTVLFRHPAFSSTTIGFVDTNVVNATTVESNFPAGNLSTRALYATWQFKSGTVDPWLRLSTYNASILPNPTVNLAQRVRFDIRTDKALKVGLSVRETGTGAGIGANGGNTGTIEFVGVSGVTSGTPQPTRTIAAGGWNTVEFNLPGEPMSAFTGDGTLSSATGKGVLEALALLPAAGNGPYNVYLDNFAVVTVSTNAMVDPDTTFTLTNSATDADAPLQALTFSLDPGAPEGAEIDPDTGVFTWTPSNQSPRTNWITVRVTDDGPGSLSDAKTFLLVVNKVNTAPNLSAFPDQGVEVSSGGSVNLTAAATDADVPEDTLTYSLVGTVPSGATIDPVTGDFSWTPPAGLSTNVITVRVTDNGVPPLYDEKDLLILVTPTNGAPVLDAIGDQIVLAGESVTFTATAADPDVPLQLLTYGLDADAPAGASINETNGLFTWITTEADAGTNSITVFVEDAPETGAAPKSDAKTFTVVVIPPDHVASLIANGDNLTLSWSTVSGVTYRVQFKDDLAAAEWTDLADLTATNSTASLTVTNNGGQRYFRLLQLDP